MTHLICDYFDCVTIGCCVLADNGQPQWRHGDAVLRLPSSASPRDAVSGHQRDAVASVRPQVQQRGGGRRRLRRLLRLPRHQLRLPGNASGHGCGGGDGRRSAVPARLDGRLRRRRRRRRAHHLPRLSYHHRVGRSIPRRRLLHRDVRGDRVRRPRSGRSDVFRQVAARRRGKQQNKPRQRWQVQVNRTREAAVLNSSHLYSADGNRDLSLSTRFYQQLACLLCYVVK